MKKQLRSIKVPSYLTILLSKQVYQEFFKVLRQNIVLELFVTLMFLLTGLIFNEYRYIAATNLSFFFLIFVASTVNFKRKVDELLIEAEFDGPKDD